MSVARGKQKKKRVNRVVTGEWPDEKIRKLISLVQLRPELWHIGSTNYRIPKPQVWQEVAAELGDAFEWHDCRIKWQNLRVTYKSNLAKMEKKKSVLSTDEEVKVPWRFFDAMRFIVCSDSQQYNESDLKLEFNEDECDYSVPLDVELSEASFSETSLQQNMESLQTTCNYNADKREEESGVNITQIRPACTSNSTVGDITAQVMQAMNRSDQHSTFGDYIASELRSLPPEQATALKRRLNRTLVDFWDDIE